MGLLTIEITPGPQAYSSSLTSWPFPASVSVQRSLSQSRCFSVCSARIFMESANLLWYVDAIWLCKAWVSSLFIEIRWSPIKGLLLEVCSICLCKFSHCCQKVNSYMFEKGGLSFSRRCKSPESSWCGTDEGTGVGVGLEEVIYVEARRHLRTLPMHHADFTLNATCSPQSLSEIFLTSKVDQSLRDRSRKGMLRMIFRRSSQVRKGCSCRYPQSQ